GSRASRTMFWYCATRGRYGGVQAASAASSSNPVPTTRTLVTRAAWLGRFRSRPRLDDHSKARAARAHDRPLGRRREAPHADVSAHVSICRPPVGSHRGERAVSIPRFDGEASTVLTPSAAGRVCWHSPCTSLPGRRNPMITSLEVGAGAL